MKKKLIIGFTAITLLLTTVAYRSDFFEIAKQIEIFTTLFKELNMNYVDETNPAALMDSAIKSMLNDLDPYTVYLNEQDVEAYKINQRGEYSGIGALVRSYPDKILIVEPYKGYPADKAGLKAGDQIIKIGDITISDVKEDADELLKGASNTTIEIVYLRQKKQYTTIITRSEVEVDAVPFYGKIDDKTGYIVLTRFNNKAYKQTKAALEDLKSQGISRLILDLRNNPGGLLNEAIDITNLFIPKGEVIVTTKSKVKKFNQVYKTRNNPVDTQIPLAVLVNGRSASASEIVSGALQDLDRAIIVGARSFGKGLVQRPLKLTYGTQLKVTISRYYTPSGRCIQALDYRNRDEQGKAIQTTNIHQFRTKNGRAVYDGGGVFPDLEVANSKSSSFTNALNSSQVIFDFATDYYYRNSISSIDQYKLSESDFNDFKSFVSNSTFSYETPAEKLLKQAKSTEEASQWSESIQNDYKELLEHLQTDKLTALDTYKSELVADLNEEILKRYFYQEGLFTYNLTHDETVKAAAAILNNDAQYRNMLH